MKCWPWLMSWKAIFVLHWCPIICSICDDMKIRVQWALPFLHPRFNLCVLSRQMCSACPFLAQEEEVFLCTYIYIYIYIYHILHTLFESLDLMGQSSELGWVHKKSSNNMCPTPLWTTMQKNKITLIYDIITLIM